MDNKRNSDLAMTSESLLHTNNNYCSAGNYKPHKGPSEAARRRRRVCLAITAVLCMVLLVLLCLFLVLCFADFAQPLKARVSESLGVNLPGYSPPAELSTCHDFLVMF